MFTATDHLVAQPIRSRCAGKFAIESALHICDLSTAVDCLKWIIRRPYATNTKNLTHNAMHLVHYEGLSKFIHTFIVVT